MRYKYKRILLSLLAGTMLVQGMSLSAVEETPDGSENPEELASDESEGGEGGDISSAISTVNLNYIPRTEDEVFASMEKIGESGNLELYFTLDQKYEYGYPTVDFKYDAEDEEEERDEDEIASLTEIFSIIGFSRENVREVFFHSADLSSKDASVYSVNDLISGKSSSYWFYADSEDFAASEVAADADWVFKDSELKLVAFGEGEQPDFSHNAEDVAAYIESQKASQACELLFETAEDYLDAYDDYLDDADKPDVTAKQQPLTSAGVVSPLSDETIEKVKDTVSLEEAVNLEMGEFYSDSVWAIELDDEGKLKSVCWAQGTGSTIIGYFDDEDTPSPYSDWAAVEAALGVSAGTGAPEGTAFTRTPLADEELKYSELLECGRAAELFALKDNESGEIWWSSPVNSEADIKGSRSYRNDLMSGIAVTVGIPSGRSSDRLSSVHKGNIKTPVNVDNGVKLTYTFDYKVSASSTVNFEIPVTYTLEDGYFNVRINTDEIVESNTSASNGAVIMDIEVFGGFGAASADEKGYFIIPDGSGAIIDFNNGKTNAKSYSKPVYGEDVTAVPLYLPNNIENISLPMFGIVKQSTAMLAVASEGDSGLSINTAVSMATKSTSYNTCSFEFNLRDSDTFYMNQSSQLQVFETRVINTPALEVRYYPVNDSVGTVDYIDVAEKYRGYLIDNEGLTVKASENDSALYVSLLGGTMTTKSVLGFPVKTELDATSFKDAKTILEALDERNVGNIVVSYEDWTDAAIEGKIDYKAKPASSLGGKSDYNDLLDYISGKNISLYNAVDNVYFTSGQGYWTFTQTAMRISGEYARLYKYELPFGTAITEEDSVSLLTPASFDKLYSDLSDNYSKAGVRGASIGSLASTLYGDYSKDFYTRYDTSQLVTEALSKLNSSVDSVISENPNQYAIPYSDKLSGIPLSSSKYDVFDRDIPFYQMVMHGVVPYSSVSINSDADSDKAFLMAIASGSNLQFDMLAVETNELKATAYDSYYYANYNFWLDTVETEYAIANEILSKVCTATIVGYSEADGIITTTYSNGTETVVDLNIGKISCDGKEYIIENYK